MLLPQTIEREYRFRLALRMGLPIFALIVALISHTLITNYSTLKPSFYLEALLLVVFSIYFIFYLIYRGSDVKITDDVTKTFTREYLYKYLLRGIQQKKEYTLLLISIDNLNDINNLYGIKNGDRVLQEVAHWIAKYLKDEGIEGYPIGHIKGGDFVLGLPGDKGKYRAVMDIMCLKAESFKVGNIEVKISGAITDTNYSKEINYLIEHLFEKQENIRYQKQESRSENIDPNELESLVIAAIKNNNIAVSTQKVYGSDECIEECFVKLKDSSDRYIFPKKYIKVINKLGLGVSFDLMVLEYILQNSNTFGKKIALNIFPTSLRDETFLARLKELMQSSKDISFVFILFEMEYYAHTDRYNALLRLLRGYNISIVIDRVGSIHTSFLYLRELDIDFIRYDSYYSSFERLDKNRNIIKGFNTIAHEKGVKSWVKNIEDTQSYQLAKELEIDFVQGKYLSELENIN
ncbi:MAG: GGDEF domain-containing protein [Epsilonproteobacteria bacterium]|nr:GGDEF domain-containing protein [Campylobacterota bacterium]